MYLLNYLLFNYSRHKFECIFLLFASIHILLYISTTSILDLVNCWTKPQSRLKFKLLITTDPICFFRFFGSNPLILNGFVDPCATTNLL